MIFLPITFFATEPLTVFDPTPSFDHPYLDLGMAIVIAVSRYESEEAVSQMIDGYFGGKIYDPQALVIHL